jgi:hypothetical protein
MCNEDLVSGDLPKAHEAYDSKHGKYDGSKVMTAKAKAVKQSAETHQPLSMKGGK